MTDAILAARNISKAFDGRQVLNDICANVAAGSVIGVLGKNGAGKTTLLEIALGFSPASSGSVQLWGHESVHLPSPIKGRIGYVPQQDELVPLLTGSQQLALTASLHRSWDHELIDRLAKVLDSLKESVVRLHLRSQQPLPERIGLAHTLHERVEGTTATISVSRWQPEEAGSLAKLLHAELEVEPLDLEDIFLELHR